MHIDYVTAVMLKRRNNSMFLHENRCKTPEGNRILLFYLGQHGHCHVVIQILHLQSSFMQCKIYIFRCGEVRCGGLRCGEVWCGEVCGEVLTSTSRMFTNYTETA